MIISRRIYIENFGQIPDGYAIHHKDNNHSNNDPGNLLAVPEYLHQKLYHKNKKRTVYLDKICDHCKKPYKAKTKRSQFCITCSKNGVISKLPPVIIFPLEKYPGKIPNPFELTSSP